MGGTLGSDGIGCVSDLMISQVSAFLYTHVDNKQS